MIREMLRSPGLFVLTIFSKTTTATQAGQANVAK